MKKKVKIRGESAASKRIFDKIVEQAMRSEQEEESAQYMWVHREIQKQPIYARRKDLISAIIRQASRWYEKYLETSKAQSAGLFYIRIVYLLYCMQFEDPARTDESEKPIEVFVKREVLQFIAERCLLEDVRDILREMIENRSLKVYTGWREYRYRTNKRLQYIESELEALFGIDAEKTAATEEYLRKKKRYENEVI